MQKINAILIGLNFQKLKHMISFPRTLVCNCHLDTNFIFSTKLYKYGNTLKYIASKIESVHEICDQSDPAILTSHKHVAVFLTKNPQ